MSKENSNEIGTIIESFENECNPTYQNIIDVYCDRGSDKNGEIVYEIHVTIEDNNEAPPGSNTYCHTVADFGRERGLFLWDTVSNWMDRTVTLRFRFQD